MDAKTPTKADIDALMAQVTEQREEVRRLQEEVESLTKIIEELRSRPPEVAFVSR